MQKIAVKHWRMVKNSKTEWFEGKRLVNDVMQIVTWSPTLHISQNLSVVSHFCSYQWSCTMSSQLNINYHVVSRRFTTCA